MPNIEQYSTTLFFGFENRSNFNGIGHTTSTEKNDNVRSLTDSRNCQKKNPNSGN